MGADFAHTANPTDILSTRHAGRTLGSGPTFHGFPQCVDLYATLSPRPEALQLAALFPTVYVVSGGSQDELRAVFNTAGIAGRFAEICGSPTGKPEHIRRILVKTGLTPGDCLFVGDGFTDFKTSQAVGCEFVFLSEMSDWHRAEEQMHGVVAGVSRCASWGDLLARIRRLSPGEATAMAADALVAADAAAERLRPAVIVPRRVVFLDVEGVLVTLRCLLDQVAPDDPSVYRGPADAGIQALERSCLRQLRRVLETCDAHVVLSTTWRLEADMREHLLEALADAGIPPSMVVGDTPDLDDLGRGFEIQSWLADNGDSVDA